MGDDSPWGRRVKALEEEWFTQAQQGIRDTYVYRYFDASDALLYVGQTGNPGRRHSGHKAKSPWFDLVAKRELRGPVTKPWALMEEFVAIGTESPLYNAMAHNGYTGPGSDHWLVAMSVEYRKAMDADDDFTTAQLGWFSGVLNRFADTRKPEQAAS